MKKPGKNPFFAKKLKQYPEALPLMNGGLKRRVKAPMLTAWKWKKAPKPSSDRCLEVPKTTCGKHWMKKMCWLFIFLHLIHKHLFPEEWCINSNTSSVWYYNHNWIFHTDLVGGIDVINDGTTLECKSVHPHTGKGFCYVGKSSISSSII